MRTKAIIRLDCFKYNINAVKKRTGNRHICLPVKADAYGHGAVRIAKAGIEAGIKYLGVATVQEGTELRKAGLTCPILLFCQPHKDEIPEVLSSNLIPFISDKWFADMLNKQALKEKTGISVHLKIDTGMGRLGCFPAHDTDANSALSLAKYISNCKKLHLAGIATHFAVSDSSSPNDIKYTKKQIAIFSETVKSIKLAGIDTGVVHAANSGGVLLHSDSWFDMVRPGLLLYGYKTAEEPQGFPYKPIKVKPVMELQTVVSHIKKIKKGESVSYNRTWKAPGDTNIAILSAGYADGFPRLASNKWQVSIKGKSYPVVGNICMDQCCIDAGPDSTVKKWDKAVIFGGCNASAADLANVANTIPYEITCNINKRVPREYQ